MAQKKVGYLAGRLVRKIRREIAGDPTWQPPVPVTVPRILWIYWDQGFDQAPDIAKVCLGRWRAMNPDWDIRPLDRHSIAHHLDMPVLPGSIEKAHFADVLRTGLLAKHGGVWADATTWCERPLDEWLPPAAQAGFFVYCWTKADRRYIRLAPRRLLANWFIAAAPGNELVAKWDQLTRHYWEKRQRTTNYFWHNDIVEYLRINDRVVESAWQRMPKYGAMAPHLVYDLFENGGDREAVRRAVAGNVIPVHKLSWRMHTPIEAVTNFLESCREGG